MKKQLSVFLFGALLLGAAGTFTSCKDYDDDIANLQGQIDGLGKDDEDVTTSLNSLKSDLQSKLDGVNSAISALQSAQSGMQAAIDEAKANADAAGAAAAEAEANAIEAATQQLETVKSGLEAAIAANQAAIAANQAAIEGNTADIEELKAALEGMKASLTELIAANQAAINGNTADISALKAALDEVQGAINGNAAEISALQAALDGLQAAMGASDKAIKDNAAAIKDNKDAIAALQAALKGAQTTIEAELSEFDGRIRALETFQGTTESTLKDLQAARATLDARIQKLEEDTKAALEAHGERLGTIETQIAALEKFRENYKNDSIKVEGEIDDVRKQLLGLDALEQAVSDADKKLAAYQAANDGKVNELSGNVAGLTVSVTGLQEQADSLKAQLAEAQKQLESANVEISGLKTTVEGLQGDLGTLQGDLGALRDELAALKAGQLGDADLEAIRQQITEQVNQVAGDINKKIDDLSAQMQTQIDGLSVRISNVEADLDLLSQALGKQVTHVSLYYATTESGPYTTGPYDFALDLKSAKAVLDWKFVEGKFGAIPFSKNGTEAFADSFLIRVSPTTAFVDKEDIKLVNSKGDDLSSLVDITDAEPYGQNEGELLTRATSASGLWKVTVKLKNDYNQDAYDKAAYAKPATKENPILYAVMVGDSATDVRRVVSEYGLTIAPADKDPVYTLEYTVTVGGVKTNVKDIHNRWDGSKPTETEGGLSVAYEEKAWKAGVSVYDHTKPANIDIDSDPQEARATKPVLGVQPGEPFTVSISGDAADAVRAFYVTLDEQCAAAESQPSEINVWKLYGVAGLDTVIDVKNGSLATNLTIPANPNVADGDIIGFRVYAVNYDGTLVDPDGKAFYVKFGTPATGTEAKTTITPRTETTGDPSESSDSIPASVGKVTGASTADWVTDKIGSTTPVFHAVFIDANNRPVLKTDALGDLTSTDFSKVAKIYTVPVSTLNWYDYKDNGTWTGTLTVRDADGFALKTITVTMTKTLPTGLPAGFSIKTSQPEADNQQLYKCYLVPSLEDGTFSWAAESADYGTMDMDNIFNWGTGNPAQYVVTFANAKNEGNRVVAAEARGNGDVTTVPDPNALKVEKSFIDDGKTQHSTSVAYDYGQISSDLKNADGTYRNYLSGETVVFQTEFHSIYDDSYSWNWATLPQLQEADPDGAWTTADIPDPKLTYGGDPNTHKVEWKRADEITPIAFEEIIFGTSKRDSKYSKMLNQPFEEGGDLSLSNASVEVKGHVFTNKEDGTVDETKMDEYFTIEDNGGTLVFSATKTADSSNPTADVPSTLRLYYKDMYGKDVKVDVPVTVLKR